MWPTEPDGFEPGVAAQAGDDAFAFVFDAEGRLLGEARPWGPPERGVLRWLEIEIEAEHYLGRFRGRDCVALWARVDALPDGWVRMGLRELLGHVEPELFYLAGRASQVLRWDREHRFCGACGAATKRLDRDRARACPECGHTCYPRLSPSIIVLVHDRDRILLARNVAWPEGFYSTLAGFVEPGESLEQCVHREVHEEVGLRVRDLRYLGSQSWPFPNSLMVGYHATYAGGEIRCQEDEIAEARWFGPDDLPKLPPPTAISRWLIEDWLRGNAG